MFAIAALVVAVGVVALAVTERDRRRYDFPSDALSVMSLVVPAAALPAVAVTEDRNDIGFRQSWRFDVETTWEEYVAWVAPRLAPRFMKSRTSPTELRYVERTEGDIYTVVVEPVEPGPPLELHAIFAASAY